MKVKKAGKIIFGADLTREEQEALQYGDSKIH